jgi:hypothetical protein
LKSGEWCAVFQRLKLLRRLQEVDIESLDEGLELLERVKTNTSRAEEYVITGVAACGWSCSHDFSADLPDVL